MAGLFFRGTEFFGGIAIVLGLFTRFFATAFIIEMAVAVWKVHFKNGLMGNGGYEFPLAMATSAFGLLCFCKRTYFDLALIDYEMPLMSGSQLAREIKFLVPDVPVVLISGRAALPATELTFVDAHFGFGTALDDLLWTMRILVRPKLAIADHLHANLHRADRHRADQREMTQWADST